VKFVEYMLSGKINLKTEPFFQYWNFCGLFGPKINKNEAKIKNNCKMYILPLKL